MKKILCFLSICLLASATFAQGPVGVNDTVTSHLGEYVTVNVINNDYSPEGLPIRVQHAFDAYTFTDSTITYFLDYNMLYNYTDKYLKKTYLIIDENDQGGSDAHADVLIELDNNAFYDTLDIGNIGARVNAYNNQFWGGAKVRHP